MNACLPPRKKLVTAEWLPLRIREIEGSKLSRQIELPNSGFFVVLISPSMQIPRSYVMLSHDRFFPNPLLFIYHPVTRGYMVVK